MTFMQAATGADTLLKKTLMVMGGSLFIAIAAQFSVPFIPVPLTLQTLAILIVGLSFGSRLGALTVVAYLLEGAAGLPVFANGGSAPALVGPTAGFLIGFVALAYIAGWFAERTRNVVALIAGALIASAVLYIPGVAWPMYLAEIAGIEGKWVASSASSIWTYWVSPFLIGDAVKSVLAVLVVTGALKALKKA